MLFAQLSLAFGLSMDAVAASICKSAPMKSLNKKIVLQMAFLFGFFQALMPIIGGLIGANFEFLIKDYDHWIAFILLCGLGLNMLRSGLFDKQVDACDIAPVSLKQIIVLAIATSIDALAAGVSISFSGLPLITTSLIIGVITSIMCLLGCLIGYRFGSILKNKAEIIGGLLLILVGIKIVLEHLSI